MLISSEQIREIRNTVNLADIIGKRINLKMAGSRLRARCPFHDEKTPSFFVDPTRNSFICFGCGEKGDVYDFLMKYDGLTFVEAVKRAADEAGIVLKQVDNAKEKELREKQARKNSLYQVNAKVTKFFQEKLVAAEGAQCRQYLQNRGIGDEAVKEFKLGFAPDSWDALLSYLQKTGDLAAAESNGLVRPGKSGGYYDFFRNRLIFPIIDAAGRICGFSGRKLNKEDRGGKYINSTESSIFTKGRELFGISQARRAILQKKSALLVEGNIDVVKLHEADFKETVAPLGTALTSHHISNLKRYSQKVYLVFDGDSAGQKACLKSIPLLTGANFKGGVIQLPEGEDPDSFIINAGQERFQELMEQAEGFVEYYISKTVANRKEQIHARIDSLSRLAPLWSRLSSSKKAVYREFLSVYTGIGAKKLQKLLQEVQSSPDSQSVRIESPGSSSNKPVEQLENELRYSSHFRSELKTIFYLFSLRLHWPQEGELVEGTDVLSRLNHSVARDIWRLVREKKEIDQEFADLLGLKIMKKFTNINWEVKNNQNTESRQKLFSELVRYLEKIDIDYRTKEINRLVSEARKHNDLQKVKELLNQKLELQKKRVKLF